MKRWIVRAAVAAHVCGFITLSTARSYAQSADAQELFDAAKKLTKEGKFEDACPKFEESQRLDPAPGTQFFLADCWEHVGRTASAWAAYVEVADQSQAAGQKDREKVARERANKLTLKLSRLSVVVHQESRVPGLVVKRDGIVLREPQWGVPVPVDPGPHSIEASAPGVQPWQTSSDVRGEGKTTTIEVPKLGTAATAIAAKSNDKPSSASTTKPAEGDTSSETGSTQRTIGLVVGGVGVVGIAVGSYFGLRSMSKHKDYEDHCSDNVCDQSGVDLHDQAVSAGNLSTVAFAIGLAAVTTGVVLYLTAPKAKTSLAVGPAFGGIHLSGKF